MIAIWMIFLNWDGTILKLAYPYPNDYPYKVALQDALRPRLSRMKLKRTSKPFSRGGCIFINSRFSFHTARGTLIPFLQFFSFW